MDSSEGLPPARAIPRIVQTDAGLDEVMRYFAQGYELGAESLLRVEYAITEGRPRRVWFRLTVRDDEVTT